MNNSWSAGQFVVFRFLFGCWLCLHYLQIVPWGVELFSHAGAIPRAEDSPLLSPFNLFAWCDAPAFVTGSLLVAAAAGSFLALGLGERCAALLLWYIGACALGRNPLIANPGLPYVGWILLAIALLPRARFGDSQWRMPRFIFLAAWVGLTVGYAYSGWTKLDSPSWVDGSAMRHVLHNPLARAGAIRQLLLSSPDIVLRWATWGALALELSAPLALIPALRRWLWCGLLGMHLGLMGLLAFADLSMGMVMMHLFTADPGWIRPREARLILFYDGHCGLCHRFVSFALAEDRLASFRFAPLAGDTFAAIPGQLRRGLADSLIVQTSDGALLQRSRAVAACLDALGGCWRCIALALRAIPRPIADFGYDAIARIRYRLFKRPDTACPLMPAALKSRFLS